MTKRADNLMESLHGTSVYAGFVPTFAQDMQGWNSHHPVFRDIIGLVRPDTVIDVGVWKGVSTIFLASIMRDNGIDGAVIGVDSFLGMPHHDPKSEAFKLIPRQFGRPMLYEQFMANVVRSEMQDIIIPLPQSTTNAADVLRRCGVQAGLVHIDAAHDYASVLADARAFWPIVASGGYMVGDDYHKESWPGVVKAADEFAAELGLTLEVQSPKWIVRKP